MVQRGRGDQHPSQCSSPLLLLTSPPAYQTPSKCFFSQGSAYESVCEGRTERKREREREEREREEREKREREEREMRFALSGVCML